MSLPTYQDLEAAALAYLDETHIGAPPRPESEAWHIVTPAGELLAFPSGRGADRCLDDIDWPELGRWLGHLAGWLAYARHLTGLNAAVRTSAESLLKRARASAFARADGKVTERRAEAETDPTVDALAFVEAEAHARAKLLEGETGALEAMYAAISREQSRRTGEHGTTGATYRSPT